MLLVLVLFVVVVIVLYEPRKKGHAYCGLDKMKIEHKGLVIAVAEPAFIVAREKLIMVFVFLRFFFSLPAAMPSLFATLSLA
jgi:hypothetical protein